MSQEKSWKRELAEDAVIVVLVLLVVWGSGMGLQFYLQTPTPLLAVESESMEPVLYRGDLVVVRAVDPTTLQVGDIVIYNASSNIWAPGDVPIVHRIIEIQNISGQLFFITKGDNNPGPDWGNRTASDILALVIGKLPYFGFVPLLLISPAGLPSIIMLVVVFLVTSFVCDSFAPSKKNEEPETLEPST